MKHIEGDAFDIAMTNHDYVAVEAAARAVGFYPRSGFTHVDLGPARSWGEPFPVWAAPFASQTTPMCDLLVESQKLKGAGTAGVETHLASPRSILYLLASAGFMMGIYRST